MRTAFAIARTTPAACSGSRIRLQPALSFAIFGTGQPMLTSTMSAPMPSTTRAAAAIRSGSPPKIWIDTGRSSSVYSGVLERPVDAADEALGADHLGDDEAAAALALDQAAEGACRSCPPSARAERRWTASTETDLHDDSSSIP